MSSDKPITSKEEKDVFEGDDNEEPPSNGDQLNSELSDDYEGSDSDRESDRDSERQTEGSDAQKRESALISGGQGQPEDSPSTSKKAKQDDSSEKQKRNSKSLDSKETEPNIGCSPSKKTKEDPPSSDDSEVSPPGSLSTPPRTSRSPDKRKSPLTPILESILKSTPLIIISPIRDAPELQVTPPPPSEPQAPAQHSALRDILSKPPIIPLPSGSAATNAPKEYGQDEEKKPNTSETRSDSPMLRRILEGEQSSSDSRGTIGFSTPHETGSQQPPANTSEPMTEQSSPTGTEQISDIQGDNSEEEIGSEVETSTDETYDVEDGQDSTAEDYTRRLHDSKSPSSVSEDSFDAKQSGVPSQSSRNVQADDGDISSPPPSSPSAKTIVSKVLDGKGNDSRQLQGAENKNTSQSLTDATEVAKHPAVESKHVVEDEQISCPSNTPEPDGDTDSGSAQIDPDMESEPSVSLDETAHLSGQISSHSSSLPSNAGPSNAPDVAPVDSSEVSMEVDTIPVKSKAMAKRMQKDINLKDSGKTDTPGRKNKRQQGTKKQSGSKSASNEPEVPKAVNPESDVFKKPTVTPQRMQTMKNRLEGMNLEGARVPESPRRSGRIQSTKPPLEKEKAPGDRAASGGKTKISQKSKPRERVAEPKEGEAPGGANETKEVKTRKTRSRDSTPATGKPKKRGTVPTGSREHTPSDENVAGRTRGSKTRLASTSSNSEADKTEDEESVSKRKTRKDSSK